MAAAQATFEFPLISLPQKHQLLVAAFKNKKTHQEHITLLTLCPLKDVQIKDDISIPKTEFIRAIYSPETAYTEFNRIFDKATKEKYQNLSLRKKMIKAFDNSSMDLTTQQQIIAYLSWRTDDYSISLLNVQDFAMQFTNLNVQALDMQKMESKFSIKALYHILDTLSNTIRITNSAIHIFLIHIENKASKLYWTIADLKIKYDIERLTRKHAFRLLHTHLDIPKQTPVPRELILKLFNNLNDTKKNNVDLSRSDQFWFIKHGFTPSRDSWSEILSSAINTRILRMNSYRNQINLLHNFCEILKSKFETQIFFPPSDEDSDTEPATN